jgi:uncharacterized cupin superfamily protein
VSELASSNVFEPVWDVEADRGPYRWRRSRVGRRAGGVELGASLFEIAAGGSSFPLHAHHANEEMIVVLAGTPTLRTLAGERVLAPGDVVACPRGRQGAHRLDNRSEGPVRVLVVSTMHAPDVNEFPESGLVWARTYAPGQDAPSDALELAGQLGGLDPLSLP